MNRGDKVNIYWENLEPELNVEFLNGPQQLGDEYCFKRTNGTIIMVKNYAMMECVEPNDKT